ncbi:hypothetical protein ZWY2020_032972 [Hordeum vulgare]|nr:hypothetical protein ZWY2020_032972 [Hordeum vulgare]
MASAAFSIRRYAEKMRVEAAAEGRRPFYIEDLSPIKAPIFSWWADELGSAVAAAGADKPKKKRSISKLLNLAPPLDVPPDGGSGCNEQTEVDGAEVMCAIVRQAKEEKCKRRRQAEEDEEAAATAAPENTGGREPDENFAATKDAFESLHLPDGLDTHRSQKPETPQHHRKVRENISGEINSAKKADTQKCIDRIKTNTQKCILTYTRRTSVKMAKEKHGNSKEVVELCRRSENRVDFSEADSVLGRKMRSCELPEQQSVCKLLLDAMAPSSSSSSSSTSMEEDKCVAVGSSTSHMPKETFTKTNEATKHCDHHDNNELSNRKMSAPFDLNMAPPECTYLDCAYDSNLEVPNVENTHDETSNSDAELLVGPPLSLRELGETSTSTRQTVRLMGKELEVCMTRGESFAETAKKHTVNSTSTIEASTYHASTSQAHVENMNPYDSSNPFPTANVSSGDRLSYENSHPGPVVQEVSNSTGNVALFSGNLENGTGRAVPDNSSGDQAVQERSGLVKLTPGAKHILVPSDSTHGNSLPVHSCLPFGSRGKNAAGSQNKGA